MSGLQKHRDLADGKRVMSSMASPKGFQVPATRPKRSATSQ